MSAKAGRWMMRPPSTTGIWRGRLGRSGGVGSVATSVPFTVEAGSWSGDVLLNAGASFGVMLAPKEAERGAVAIKDLRTGDQLEVPREQVAGWIRTRTEPTLEVDG